MTDKYDVSGFAPETIAALCQKAMRERDESDDQLAAKDTEIERLTRERDGNKRSCAELLRQLAEKEAELNGMLGQMAQLQRFKWNDEQLRIAQAECDSLQSQLAAERERAENAARQYADLNDLYVKRFSEREAARAEANELREASADDLRKAGWAVAVHNDYRLAGEPHTFWLFTKDGRCIKGEGKTDADALNECRARIDAKLTEGA